MAMATNAQPTTQIFGATVNIRILFTDIECQLHKLFRKLRKLLAHTHAREFGKICFWGCFCIQNIEVAPLLIVKQQ